MASQLPASVLSPELSAKLASFGARLADGPPDHELEEILACLSALPANLIVRASQEIAATANLSWWKPPNPVSLARFLRKPRSNRDLLTRNSAYAWLLLFHYDGYVRELALDAIEKPPASPFFFAALAWRLNDWAEPVRQAAKRCAKRVLHLTDTDTAVIGAFYLLDRRLIWGRWRDEAEVLDDLFARQDVMAALAVQFRERPTGPLAICFRHALRYPAIDEHLSSLAAHAVQPAVRAVAYQCLLTGKATWSIGYEWAWIDKVYGLRRRVPKMDSRDIQSERPIAELIRQGIQDKSARVRSLAADALIEARRQLPDADSLIGQLAKDRSHAVRWRADYMLRHPTTSPA